MVATVFVTCTEEPASVEPSISSTSAVEAPDIAARTLWIHKTDAVMFEWLMRTVLLDAPVEPTTDVVPPSIPNRLLALTSQPATANTLTFAPPARLKSVLVLTIEAFWRLDWLTDKALKCIFAGAVATTVQPLIVMFESRIVAPSIATAAAVLSRKLELVMETNTEDSDAPRGITIPPSCARNVELRTSSTPSLQRPIVMGATAKHDTMRYEVPSSKLEKPVAAAVQGIWSTAPAAPADPARPRKESSNVTVKAVGR
jgi:hypothetical protein